jgi:hypothetical protein
VVAAAVVEGSGFDSLAACATAISTLWGLKVEIDELREVVDRLVEDGFAERQGGGLVLSREAIAHQEQVAMESEAIEADVRRRKQPLTISVKYSTRLPAWPMLLIRV